METRPEALLCPIHSGEERRWDKCQARSPRGVLLLAWWMEERRAGLAVASGILLLFVLPPVGGCHCHYHLPSYSN